MSALPLDWTGLADECSTTELTLLRLDFTWNYFNKLWRVSRHSDIKGHIHAWISRLNIKVFGTLAPSAGGDEVFPSQIFSSISQVYTKQLCFLHNRTCPWG